MTTVLQLSDLHVEPVGTLAYGKADTASHVRNIRPWLQRFAPKVDLVVVTGDIACDGKPDAYEIVAETFADLPVPVRMLPGNHDRRSNLVRILPDFVEPDAGKERVEFTMERDDALILGLDTLQPGRHWGGLSDASLSRLQAALSDGRPVLALMHHTPVHSGMGKMDEPFTNRERLPPPRPSSCDGPHAPRSRIAFRRHGRYDRALGFASDRNPHRPRRRRRLPL